MTKGELKSIIKEMLREELNKGNYLKEARVATDDKLLATYVVKNPEFETACMSGDATKIMTIIDDEMQKNNMTTPGARKLRDDVFMMTRGNARVPAKIGEHILFFVWNSQLSGTGNKVIA